MNDGERKALDDIERYGCHVISVLAEEELPPFAYSVGIHLKTGKPELIVIGLKQALAHSIVNLYNERVVSGEIFEAGKRYADFIGGFDCELRAVHRSHYPEHFGYCYRLYKNWDFQALQLIYPTTTGIWPWETEADDWFRMRQPMLDVADHKEGS